MPSSITVESLLPVAARGAGALRDVVGRWVMVGQLPSESSDWSYRTGAMATERGMHAVRTATGELEAMIDSAWSVFALRKRDPKGAFASTILIGRAATNDVILAHSSVSKLHARVRIRDDGLVLSDAGSSNGTIVNGDQLGNGEDLALGSTDLLRFGGVALQLFETTRLCEVLQEIVSKR
jgi:hypothetical protein